jgi:hypothetical protein
MTPDTADNDPIFLTEHLPAPPTVIEVTTLETPFDGQAGQAGQAICDRLKQSAIDHFDQMIVDAAATLRCATWSAEISSDAMICRMLKLMVEAGHDIEDIELVKMPGKPLRPRLRK